MVTTRSTGSKATGFKLGYDNYLNAFGTKITLYNKTDTRDSQGRLTEQSETSSVIKCDIQYVNKQDLLHLNLGDVEIGDGMLFVKYNATINIHDEVELTSDSVRWRVINQIEGELVTGELVYKGYIIRKND